MSTCYIYSETGTKLSQKDLIERIGAEVIKNPGSYNNISNELFSKSNNQETVSNVIEQLHKNKKGAAYEGVSHFLDQKHLLEDNGIPTYLAPQFVEENYIKNYVQQHLSEGLTAEQLEEQVRQQLADSAIESEIGTLQHALIQALFDTEGQLSSQQFKDAQKAIKDHLNDTSVEGRSLVDSSKTKSKKTLREIITEQNPTLSDDQIVKVLTNNALKVYNSITTKYPDAKFFAECNLYGDINIKTSDPSYKGLKGIADLIIVKKDGSVDIIDFKVCTHYFDEWSAAKLYHTEYQLGVYRQLLAQHGLDASKMGLFIQPIYLNKNNAEDTRVQALQDALKASANNSSHARLDWKFGTFTQNIKYLIPSNLEPSEIESLKIDNTAMESFAEIVDYKPYTRNYSADKLIELAHEVVKDGKKVWIFFDQFSRQNIVKSSREAMMTYLQQVYIPKSKNVTGVWITTLIKDIEEYRNNPSEYPIDSQAFLNSNRNSTTKAILQNIFSEYTKPWYKTLDFPVFTDNGVLAFLNTETNTISFLVITDQSLTANYANGQFGSIFGTFMTNDQVRELNGVTVLPAECQWAEMIKAVHLINCVQDSNPEFFADKTIQVTTCINPMFGENNSGLITTKQLIDIYDVLCIKAKITNHFNDSIQIAEPWNDFLFSLNMIMKDEDSPLSEQKIRALKKYTNPILKNNISSVFDKVQSLLRLRKGMEEQFPNYRAKDFVRQQIYDIKDPIDALFVNVSKLIMYYQNIPIDFRGNIDKYGLRANSVMQILGLPFVSNQALGDRGIGNGLYTTSAENSPSATLRALNQYYNAAYTHIREQFQKQHKIITDLTLPYISKYESQVSRLFKGTETKKWENLLVKDAEGNISEILSLKNPYTDHSLTTDEAEFLKGILWEINKFRYSELQQYQTLNYADNKKEIENLIKTDETIQKFISSGEYFYLPLRRAREFERWKKVGRIGLKDLLLKEIETLKDDWDLTQTHESHKSQMIRELKENATTMYNQYRMSPADRQALIKAEGIHDFELDLDYLAMDVAFQSIRANYFENVLQTTAACATVLHINQAITGINRHPELEAMDTREKSVIKNQNDVPEELENVSKVVSAARKLNSLLVLAFRPMQMIKELTFGQFTNVSRAFSTKGSSDKLTLKNIFLANKTIWGQSVGKWAGVFAGNQDMASYTLCESINKLYAVANEDISRVVDNSVNSRLGMLANLSKWMYLANSAPDYFNRLTLFVAKMMEDGCFDAHSLNEDGNLVYDFKKDKRFSELNKHGLNSNYNGEEYKKQKALYLAMLDDFAAEGRNFAEYDKNGNLIYKEFDIAYTTKQRNSIKEVADLAYGYYDHETKSLIDVGFFGLIYRQFQTFLTAKVNLWLKGRPTTKGDNTAQGHYEIVTKNGEKCYRRLNIDKDGKILGVQIVPESQLTEDEKENLDYAMYWQGDYVEGLVYSIGMTLHDLFHLDFKSIANNKYRLGNLALAMHDLLIGMLLYSIFKWLFSGGTKKMSDIPPLQRTLVRAMQDVSPSAITSVNWEPGFVSSLSNLRDNALSILSDDDPDIKRFLTRNVAAIRDWTYNQE